MEYRIRQDYKRSHHSGLLIVTSEYFVAGMIVYDGIVQGRIAPIIAYMRSWQIEAVYRYAKKKGWTLKGYKDVNK